MSRTANHVAAFNQAVSTGEWHTFANRFAVDATMRFSGIPIGPWTGRASILAAYVAQPPTDTLAATAVETSGDVDVVTFLWSSGGTGTMRLRWTGVLVAEMTVSFD